ncbi:MAG: N-acetylmuramoyl-L-alanine amidase [Candidatus Omnitrophica bacterium]|nr:N-acetylmuramoyl-L-alanine amidase [Candidatus Omnitrophota bacterium]MDD5429945.1 N-acetylmuramoyl-L-alanine amidase [Candidatus Omnitrophota bacterium]
MIKFHKNVCNRLDLSSIALCLKFFIAVLLLAGCATVTSRGSAAKPLSSRYQRIDDFSRDAACKYNYDTVDDIITLNLKGKEVKLLLNSCVGTSANVLFTLRDPVLYFNGEIFVPLQLATVLRAKGPVSFSPGFSVKTIVIDPGHGGKDPGAISARGLQEKAINLIVSEYLKDELQKRGYKVILTRCRDEYLTLKQRVDVAKRNSADLFISIHANANHSAKVSGVEVYYLSPSRLNSNERAVKLAKTEDFNGGKYPKDVKAILWDLLITKNYASSVQFSNTLYFVFKNMGFKVKPPKKAPFYVLRFAYVPSVLVEIGYLTNHYEEKILRKQYYQKQIAQAIALAVESF